VSHNLDERTSDPAEFASYPIILNPKQIKHDSCVLQGNEKFKQLVNDWQTKLGTVEAVLGCWGDVQKKWQALESIFIGSADIRVQLPEDSKRFDAINADFQDLMRSAPDVTGVVEACNLEGRDERLNNLLSQLEMCEKALQVRAKS
jgi:dynein heavy chain, axonemal